MPFSAYAAKKGSLAKGEEIQVPYNAKNTNYDTTRQLQLALLNLCLQQHFSCKAPPKKHTPHFTLSQSLSLLHEAAVPYRASQSLSKTRSREVPALTHSPWGRAGGQAPAWHCHTTAAHTTASPISCPWLCSSHQLGVEKTEGRDLPPHSRLKKKAMSAIYRSHQDFNSFLSFSSPPPPPPADFRLTMSTKLQVKNCRLYFSKPLILILLLQSFDCLKRIKE